MAVNVFQFKSPLRRVRVYFTGLLCRQIRKEELCKSACTFLEDGGCSNHLDKNRNSITC